MSDFNEIKDIGVWQPLHDKFNSEKYLYHYTNFIKAIKILDSQKLIFSPLTSMNDTSEYKSRIDIDSLSIENEVNKDEAKKMLSEVEEYLNSNAKNLRLLCFSQDYNFEEGEHENIPFWEEYSRFFDLHGRGCALPRMWAQYASNNEGVCLIFDKEKLISAVQNKGIYNKPGKVEYKDYFYKFPINYNDLKKMHLQIAQNVNGILPIAKLFDSNEEFIHYNYFVKLKDWQNENEFRILALTDNDNEISIDNLFDYLVGIVVGEKNHRAFTNALKLFLADVVPRIPVKEIVFGSQICKFKE